MARNDMIEIACEIVHETDRAVLVNDGDIEVWLPLSQVEVTDASVLLPEWLAEERGLI